MNGRRTRGRLRTLLVGLSALGGLLVFIGLFAIAIPIRLPDWLGLLFCAASFFCGGYAGWRLCGRPRLIPRQRPVRSLEDPTKFIREAFAIRRAFQVEEFEDEGLHFFLELEDRRVLSLSGQYLYALAEASGDGGEKTPPRFPCSSFVVTRHIAQQWIAGIDCEGSYLEPECLLPHFSEAYLKKYGYPTDGRVLTVAYDELLRRAQRRNA